MHDRRKSPFKRLSIWTFATRLEVFFATALVNVLSLALPLALLQVYDRVIPNQSYGTIAVLIAGVGVAIGIEALMRFARAHVMGTVGARFEHQAGIAAMKHMLSSDVTHFEQEGSGVHIERFNAIHALRDYYGGQTIVALIDLPFVLLFIVLVFYFGGELGVVLCVLILIFGLGVLVFGRRLGNAVNILHETDDNRFDTIIGALQGISTIKAQAMEPLVQRKLEMLSLRNAELGKTVSSRLGSLVDLGAMMSQLSIVSIVAYGGILVANGQLSLGGLAACTLLAGRAMRPLGDIISFWTRYQSIRSARRRFDEIFKVPLGAHLIGSKKGEPNLKNDGGVSRIAAKIFLKDVCFKFEDSDKELLTNINMNVRPGEFIAVTGPNGSGKSILLTLIRGMLQPTSGNILIDGVFVRDWMAPALDEAVSYLPQHETIFSGTILENITAYRPERENQALAAAKLVGLSEWIQLLPDGFRSRVGNGSGGRRLPRGIAQRVALARALVNNPRVFLIDDANSAVDQTGDVAVKLVLSKLKGYSTIIVVSHRPSILKLADRIFYLSEGNLVEEVAETKPPALEETVNV